MKPTETFEVTNGDGTVLTRGKYYRGSKTPHNLVIAQVGLGATIDQSGFIGDLRENADRYGDYSLAAIEHPGHGINNTNPGEKTIWTLQNCEEATLWAIHQILEEKKPEKVILTGNSLGFWTLYNALAKAHGMNPAILALLGKSGIASYKTILGRLLGQFGSAENSQQAWQKLMTHLKIGEDGWGLIQTNPQDSPVPLHRHLLDTICILNERDATDTYVECWHGDKDEWTNIAEMEAHNLGEITVHRQRESVHSLSHSGDDRVSRQVNRDIIHRIKEIFSASSS